jgi:anti-anti-sigma regulatory factor
LSGGGLALSDVRKVEAMLRITQSETSKEQKWKLCGRLSGPWVAELQRAWEQCRSERRSDVIDLSDVTSIDECGESLLRMMKQDGARFVARGVEMKAILSHLLSKSVPPLRKSLAHIDGDAGLEEKK